LYSLGHREILYFGRRKNSVTHQLRAEGYLDTCKKLRIEPQVYESGFASSSIAAGYQMAKPLFQKKLRPTAIFAATDSLALGIMGAAEEAGIDIPGALSVMGFDNITYSGLPRINLTTINQPKKSMGTLAVDMLLEKINDPSVGYSHRILAPSLVERGSCRKIV
jgi:LacI family transcriptional regulator